MMMRILTFLEIRNLQKSCQMENPQQHADQRLFSCHLLDMYFFFPTLLIPLYSGAKATHFDSAKRFRLFLPSTIAVDKF
jgi:hypothetical protein